MNIAFVGWEQRGSRVPASVAGTPNFQGASALKSTIRDILAYARWQLDARHPAVALMHQPTYGNEDFSIGLNWQILREGERRVIWQDGAIPGYASLCIVQPKAQLALVILSDELDASTWGRRSGIGNRIMAAVEPRSVKKTLALQRR